jgi:hypothetical protein
LHCRARQCKGNADSRIMPRDGFPDGPACFLMVADAA